MNSVHLVPIDKEQPELPDGCEHFTMEEVPFPGEEMTLTDHDTSEYGPQFEVQVIRRRFFVPTRTVILYVRVLPPQGTPA